MAAKALTNAREDRAWELSTKGFSTRSIAKILAKEGLGTISHVGVSKALIRVHERILPDMNELAMRHKKFQFEAIMQVYRDAMGAWRRSRRGEHGVKEKRSSLPNVPATVPGTGTQGQAAVATPFGRIPGDWVVTSLIETCGDSRYLRVALEALRDLREMFGIRKPDANVPAGGDGDGERRVYLVLPDNGRDPGIVKLGPPPGYAGPRYPDPEG